MWFVYALLTVIGYVGLDYFIKQASGKIDDFLGGVILNTVAVLPPLLVYLWMRFSGKDIFVSKEGVFSSVAAGLFIGFGTITFIKMFATGTNLSLGSPLVRIGTIVGTVLIGTFLLRESLSPRQIVGILLSVFGLILVLSK